MQIDDAIQEYLLQLDADGRSVHTKAQYRRHLAELIKWLWETSSPTDLDEITPGIVARFLASDHVRLLADGTPRKASSANTIRCSMRAFFRFARDAGLSSENAGRLVRLARCAPGPPRALTAAEEGRLRAALDTARTAVELRDRALVSLLLGTGLRLAEALAVRVEDVDLDEGLVRLRVQKAGGEAVVYYGADVRVELERQVGGRAHGWLFAGGDGGPLRDRHARRRIKSLFEVAALPPEASPHTLRHSFAMSLYRKTGDLLLVREALRHRTVAAALAYARCGPERLRSALLA